MKKILTALMIVTVIISLFGCSNANTNEPRQEIKYRKTLSAEWIEKTFQEVVQDSVLIVRAKKVSEIEAINDNNLVFTNNSFEILETFYGDKSVRDRITISVHGGIIGDTEHVTEGQKKIELGEEVLLMLNYPTDADNKVITKDRYVFYLPRGIFYSDATAKDTFVSQDGTISYTLGDFETAVKNIKQ